MANRSARGPRGLKAPKGKSDEELIEKLGRLVERDPKILAYIEAQAATFSDQLRVALQATGLSLKELARRTGVDDGRLSRFMRGTRGLTLESVDKLGSELELIARFPRRRKRA